MSAKEERKQTGPTPKRLKIEGDWEQAVEKAIKKKPPPKSTTKAKKK